MSTEVELNELFANRYTDDDPYYTEYLNKKEIPPPFIIVEKRDTRRDQNFKRKSTVMSTEEELNKLFANRYTGDDPYFTEYLHQKDIPPPYMIVERNDSYRRDQNFKRKSPVMSTEEKFPNRYTNNNPCFSNCLSKKEKPRPCIHVAMKDSYYSDENVPTESTVMSPEEEFPIRCTNDDPCFSDCLSKKEKPLPCVHVEMKDSYNRDENIPTELTVRSTEEEFPNRYTPCISEDLYQKEKPLPCVHVEMKDSYYNDENFQTDSTVMSTEEELNKLFANRFTDDDPYFAEYLKQKEIPPPFILVENRDSYNRNRNFKRESTGEYNCKYKHRRTRSPY